MINEQIKQIEATEFDELAELYCFALNLYLNWAKRKGLSANEFYVLYHLNAVGACTQKVIADEWQIPKQTMSVVCKNLLEKGWLEFSVNSHDKREKNVSLTALGKSIAQPIANELTTIEQKTAQEFGMENCLELIKQLKKLLALFEKNLN